MATQQDGSSVHTQHQGIGGSYEAMGRIVQQWEFWLDDDAR
jgi:hypothetical protein